MSTVVESCHDMLDLLHGTSIEISAKDAMTADRWSAELGFASAVYINFLPHQTHHQSVAAAAALRRAGLLPVPHIAVRRLASFTQLNDFLARLAGEAAVEEVLVVAGDSDQPTGPFASSLQALATGLFEKHGVRRINISGYPEGHPKISAASLDQALMAKLALIRQAGLQPQIVTQFCFDAKPVLDFLAHLSSSGVHVPVRVGLAGPASIATLAKFAIRCGIGNSVSALLRGQTSITRILAQAGPEHVVRSLADADAKRLGVTGLHLYSFGGIAATSDWIASMIATQPASRLGEG